MNPDNYLIAVAAITTAGLALIIEPVSKVLTEAIRSLCRAIKERSQK